MIITFQVQIDSRLQKNLIYPDGRETCIASNNNIKFTDEQLNTMKKFMLDFIDNVYITSERQYVRGRMYVDGVSYE